jgi:hypothetical protein
LLNEEVLKEIWGEILDFTEGTLANLINSWTSIQTINGFGIDGKKGEEFAIVKLYFRNIDDDLQDYLTDEELVEFNCLSIDIVLPWERRENEKLIFARLLEIVEEKQIETFVYSNINCELPEYGIPVGIRPQEIIDKKIQKLLEQKTSLLQFKSGNKFKTGYIKYTK